MELEKQTLGTLAGYEPKDNVVPLSVENGTNAKSGERDLESPVTDAPGLEIWNRPRINMWRYFATLYTFIIMGMNDAAYGVSAALISTFRWAPG
jgi:hypothetical protein